MSKKGRSRVALVKDCHSRIRGCCFQSSHSTSWGDVSVNSWGACQRCLRGCSTGLAASAAACHHCQVTVWLPHSGSSQHRWETAAGHPKGSIWTERQLPEGCCAHSLFLVPVSPSPHQSGLELQRPAESSCRCFSSTRARRRDTPAAGGSRPPPPCLQHCREADTARPAGRAGAGAGLPLAKPWLRQGCVCASLLTPPRPCSPRALLPPGIPPPALTLLTQGLAGSRE